MRTSMREQIRRVLSDGRWHTGLELAHRIGRKHYSTGIAAKIRDLRKPEYGGYVIESEKDVKESRRTGMQVWRFRMLLGISKDAKDQLPADNKGQCVLVADVLDGPGHHKFERT